MDIRSIRLKNKLSFESLRQHFVPSFRPKSSSSSSQHTLVSQSNCSPSSVSSYGRDRVSGEADTDTLYEIDEAEFEMSFSRNIAARHFKHIMSSSNTNADHRNSHSLLDPRSDSLTADTASLYSDAAGEPLVNDAASDYIPKSARPLIYGDKLDNSHLQQEDDAPPFRNRSASPPQPISMTRADLDYEPFRTPDHSRHRRDSTQTKSENVHQRGKPSAGSVTSVSTTVSPRPASSIDSVMSAETDHSSYQGLVPLQARSLLEEHDRLQPVLEDDPASFDLVSPAGNDSKGFYLERRSEELISGAHLEEIFADPSTMLKFTRFLSQHRPQSIPLLIYYLDSMKSIKAIKYANAIAESLSPIQGLEFTDNAVDKTANVALEKRAKEAFDAIAQDDLPAYVAHVFIQVVNISLRCRVTGTMPAHLRDASEGLAEVFCLSDPSRKDCPIVFASEEFHRTTQYGVEYAIGRNCRFLQGPSTNKNSVRRLREACEQGRESVEVFLNYRRDGSPFMNLLMVAPLMDSRGKIRYFIGAQVDVTGLCKDCTDLEGLRRLVEKKRKTAENSEKANDGDSAEKPLSSANEFQELSEMFNETEIEAVRRHGGRMNAKKMDKEDSIIHHRPRLHVRDPSTEEKAKDETPSHYPSPSRGRLLHVYQNYLLVRPAPSLRILFASPALRTPGILQSPFLSRIGGSSRVREELTAALSDGRGVTAKIRWVSGRSADEDGRSRWVHCTPLLGHNGSIGVWMVVIVDEEGYAPMKRFKNAPPVADSINGKPRSTRRIASSFNDSLESLGLSGPPSEFGDTAGQLELEDM